MRAFPIRSVVLFGVFVLCLLGIRAYYVTLPLSVEIGCTSCLLAPQLLSAWPLLAFLFLLYGMSFQVRNAALWTACRVLLIGLVVVYLLDIYIYRNFAVRLDLRDVAVYGQQIALVWGQFAQTLTWQSGLAVGVAILAGLTACVRWRSDQPVGSRWLVIAPFVFTVGGVAANVAYAPSFPSTWVVRNVVAHNLRSGVSHAYDPNHTQRLTRAAASRAPSCIAGRRERPNIVLVIAESWSPYHSARFSGLNDWTPRLDAIAAEGRWFSDLNAGGSNTNAGLIALLLGHEIYSPVQGPLTLQPFQGLWGMPSTMPRLFDRLGYHTVFMTNGNLEFSNKLAWVRDIGFAEIHGHESPEFAGHRRLNFDAVADDYLYRKVDAYVGASHEKPYLLVVENVSTHHPYTHPYTLQRDERRVFDYLDQSVAALVARLSQRDFFRDNVFMVIADHRAMTPIRGIESARFGAQAAARIPAFALSGLIEAGEDARPLHQADLLPSLVALASSGACSKRSLADMFHDLTVPGRCRLLAPNSDWHAIEAFCPQGDLTVALAGSASSITGGATDATLAEAVLDEVATQRTVHGYYDIQVTDQPIGNAPLIIAQPAVPAPDGLVLRAGDGAGLTTLDLDLATVPRHGGCNIEFVDERLLDADSISLDPYREVTISGWLIDEASQDAGEGARLVVVSADGVNAWQFDDLARSQRPDVVAHMGGNDGYAESGFNVMLPVNAMPAGSYRLGLLYGHAGQWAACGFDKGFRVRPVASAPRRATTLDSAGGSEENARPPDPPRVSDAG